MRAPQFARFFSFFFFFFFFFTYGGRVARRHAGRAIGSRWTAFTLALPSHPNAPRAFPLSLTRALPPGLLVLLPPLLVPPNPPPCLRLRRRCRRRCRRRRRRRRRRNSFSADLDGQTSYANCRFFWPESQLWPVVQQVSWRWVTANFYLNVRAREAGNGRGRGTWRRRVRRAREGARGVERAGGSLLVHPGKTRPHRQPPSLSLSVSLSLSLSLCYCRDWLFGIADFFFPSLFLSPLFFHSNTSTTVIALSKRSLSPSSRQTL